MRIGWIGVLGLAGCATAQPLLPDALTEWSARSGLQIIVPECPDALVPARAVNGTDARDELEQLLAGTKLRYVIVNSSTVAIVCP